VTEPNRGRLRRRLVLWLSDELKAVAPPEPEPEPDPEQAWKALSLVNDWIRHSEAKAGAALTAAGVVGGVLYNLVTNQHDPPWGIAVSAVMCGVLAFVSGGFAALAVIPRRKIRGQPVDFINLLYYSHVAKNYRNDEPSYQRVLRSLSADKEELMRHLANQVHANSIVADRKFNWAGWAITALVGSLISLGIVAALIGWKG
jgi:hypothetical protein